MQPVREIAQETALQAVAPETARRASWLGHGLFKKLLLCIPIGIIGNIVFVCTTTDSSLLGSGTVFSPAYIALAMVLSIVPWFTGSLRLFFWNRFLKGSMRYRDVFKIVISAELGAAISPPMIGGSAVKIGMLMRHGFSGGAAMSLTMLENLEDCAFFIVMVPIALTVTSAWGLPVVNDIVGMAGSAPIRTLLTGLFIVSCIVAMATRSSESLARRFPLWRTFTEKVRTFFENSKTTYHCIIRDGKNIFALTLLLTSMQWICRYSVVTLVIMSLGIAPQPVLFMALQVVVFALMAFVPTPGGAGGAEMLFSLLYRPFVPAGTIGVATACWRFLTFYFLLLLASILFILFSMRRGAAFFAIPSENTTQ